MQIQQAGTPTTDAQLAEAHAQGELQRLGEEGAWCTPGVSGAERARCRLYPKLSFFFDGTGNNLDQELDKPVEKRQLSNVAKLYLAAIDDMRGKESIKRYFAGVGTPYSYPNDVFSPNEDKGGSLGLGFGAGGEMRLKAALLELSSLLEDGWGAGALRYMQWVSLSVFGFSRGATLARAFVRLLIANHCERTPEGLVWKSSNGERVRLRIVFMGLFDTVASVGGPGLHMAWGAKLAIPTEVERCVHLVAAHEVRQAFPLDSVRVGRSYPPNCEEVVYPGVHSDVGGGYRAGFQGRSNQLSRIPLRYMYAQALRSGVMLEQFQKIKREYLAEMLLPDDAPWLAYYRAYMDYLPRGGAGLEALIHAHRMVHFQWRSALTQARQDTQVLGALQWAVDPAMCQAVPAYNEHHACPPVSWRYEDPHDLDKQARQLLGEHRRLVRQIPAIRHPKEGDGENQRFRPRTPYESLIIRAWDSPASLPGAVQHFFAAHVHDSVAHFVEWPCALYEQRGIFCDEDKYWAETSPATADAVA